MATIDVGFGNVAGLGAVTGVTWITTNNPANASGVLTSMSFNSTTGVTGVYMGTGYGSGLNWTKRDYENIGNVSGSGTHTFTGLNCDVQTGDMLESYCDSGNFSYGVSGGNNLLAYGGNALLLSGAQAYFNGMVDWWVSSYATGNTPGNLGNSLRSLLFRSVVR